jgi:hypothetical protein
MIWWTHHSDRTQERVWHVAAPAIVGGISLIAAAYLSSPALAAIALISDLPLKADIRADIYFVRSGSEADVVAH